MVKKIIVPGLLFFLSGGAASAQNQLVNLKVSDMLAKLAGTLSFQVWQYKGNEVAQKYIIPVSSNTKGYTGQLQIENSLWKCKVTESAENKDGGVNMNVIFNVEKGRLESSGVAIAFNFKKWSRNNYVLVPAAVYDGNRFHVVNSGYMAPYPESYYYNKDVPLLFSDCPRLSYEGGKASKIGLLTGNASTPAMCFYSPSLQQGFILLTEQGTRFGNSGLFIEENAAQNAASFIVSAPAVRERVAGFGSFKKSNDTGAVWNRGNEVTLHFRLYSFPSTGIPSLLQKLMEVRKALTGPNHPRDLTPFSAVMKFTVKHEDSARWYQDPTGSFYRSDNDNKLQLGWVGGLQVTFPLLALNDSSHRERVFKNINLVINRMQGTSGYFWGFYDHGKLLSDRNNIPDAAMVRKNSDALFWILKQILLLRAQGYANLIKPKWVLAMSRLARAFTETWKENGQFGQYINVKTGKIIIFNSTAGAIAPAGLALAGLYFHNPEYIKIAKTSAEYYYKRYVSELGLTGGCCGDILQDADSETAFGLLESMMALYYVTNNRGWLSKAKTVADLCATWVLSYDEKFPPGSTLSNLHAHVAGAVFASVQNKHAAPGVATSSADYLFRLYRATGDRHYADLLNDIIHAHAEVMETPGRPTTGMGAGTSMERIQPTDADGKEAIGMILHTSNTWTETDGMLMALEVPGIYIQTDKNEMYVFDAVKAEVIKRDNSGIILKITNPTRFDAQVSIFAESSEQAKIPVGYTTFLKWPKVDIPPGGSRIIHINSNGSLYK